MVPVLGAPDLYRFTGGRPPDAGELRERYARQVKGRSPDGRAVWRNWVARRRADGVAVGAASLWAPRLKPREAAVRTAS